MRDGNPGDLMKFNRVFFFVLVTLLAVLLTACGTVPANSWPGLASDGTHVYLADGQFVYNILLSDGSEISMQTADGPVPARFPLKAEGTKSFYAAPALAADGQLIIGSAAQSETTLYSFDPVTGTVKWSFVGPIKNPWLSGALVLGDTVYAPAGDGKLYAVNLSNGTLRWTFPASIHSLWTSPITDGKLLYLATLDHEVYAIGPDGKQVWSTKLDNGIIGAPSYVNGTLFVGTLSGNLYALNAADGKQKWVKMLDGGIWGTPATDAEQVYVGTVKGTTGMFYALKASTGEIVWSKPEEGSIVAGPLVTADQVILTTEAGRIQSYDKSGTPKWQDTIENAKLYTPPFLAGDMILIAPMNAKFLLAAYDLNGAQKWTFIAK
jgi:outer membrane protein assembly factor BamB